MQTLHYFGICVGLREFHGYHRAWPSGEPFTHRQERELDEAFSNIHEVDDMDGHDRMSYHSSQEMGKASISICHKLWNWSCGMCADLSGVGV